MNDRLADLPAWAIEDDGEGSTGSSSLEIEGGDLAGGDIIKKNDGGGGGTDIEAGRQRRQSNQSTGMDNFFRDVESIKANIDSVRTATEEIGSMNEEAMKAITTEQENELSAKLRPLVDQTSKLAKRSKTLLGLLKEENKRFRDENTIEDSDLRVRENLCNTLTRKFIDELKAYQNAQQKYTTDIRKKVARQVKIIMPDATDEDINGIIESDGGREALIRDQILAGGVVVSDGVRTTYDKAAGKYRDVVALESSVTELNQMFLDFALLVEHEGELLDQIEYQVKHAFDYVEQGNVDVHVASEYQKGIRKKQCCLMLIAVIGTVVILVATGIIP